MVRLRPFKPLYYAGEYEKATSPPFDSISRELENSLKLCDFNITHLTLPHNESENGKTLLSKWENSGKLLRSDEDIILIIEQEFQFGEKHMIRYGLIGLVDIYPDDGTIKPHEKTFSGKVSERVSVLEKTEAQLEPIFLAVNNSNMNKTLKQLTEYTKPNFSFTDTDKVITSVYFVSSREYTDLMKQVSVSQALVADGHHRLAASRILASSQQEDNGKFWSSVMVYMTDINSESLLVNGIHRAISHHIDIPALMNLADRVFGTTDTPEGIATNIIEIRVKGQSKFIDASSIKKKDYNFISPVHSLNDILLNNIIGLDEVAQENAIEYVHDPDLARKRVDSGEAEIAFIMPPWNRDMLFSIVSDGAFLPQKSTYFYPKVASGIAINRFEP